VTWNCQRDPCPTAGTEQDTPAGITSQQAYERHVRWEHGVRKVALEAQKRARP
jgi:hypothetical protein